MAIGLRLAHAETVTQPRRDRVLDWREELLRIAPELPSLPVQARLAVLRLVARFVHEDAEELEAEAA